MKKNLSNIILVLVFFIGLSVLLYPTLSDYWNSKTQSKAIIDYESALANLKPEDYMSLFAEADEYNRQLRSVPFPLMNYEQIQGYGRLLNLGGKGIMGYVTIEKINVELPIYHGTSDAVLNMAAGHLEGSSLPVGGPGTHSVITAHRGLPSSKLFTNLDKLEVGDTFTITVLDRFLTYEIDRILIVEPDEVDALQIAEGEDHSTLMTCTPYGINTHRLLVHGTRIEGEATKPVINVNSDAYRIDPLVIVPIIAAPMLFVLLIILLVRYRKKD